MQIDNSRLRLAATLLLAAALLALPAADIRGLLPDEASDAISAAIPDPIETLMAVPPAEASSRRYPIAFTGGIGAYIRSSPRTANNGIKAYPEGTRLKLNCYTTGTRTRGSTLWHHVTAPDGREGYIADAWINTGRSSAVPGEPRCGSPSTRIQCRRVNRVCYDTYLRATRRMLELPMAEFQRLKRAGGRLGVPYADYSYLNWSDNGCSTPRGGGLRMEDVFADACERHDFCYRNYSRSLLNRRGEKGNCDWLFYQDMSRVCNKLWQPGYCRWARSMYYWAVRYRGSIG